MIFIFKGKCVQNTKTGIVAPTAELVPEEVRSFEDFCENYLRNCKKGSKMSPYITIGDDYKKTPGDSSKFGYLKSDHYHRNNNSQKTAWLLPFDGDNSKSKVGSCIPPQVVHKVLVNLGYNHVIYTSHSHNPPEKIRWRLFIPCKLKHKLQLEASVLDLYSTLASSPTCRDLALSTESKTWSIPWYLPYRDDPDDGNYEFYSYYEGRDFLAISTLSTKTSVMSSPVSSSNDPRSMPNMIRSIILHIEGETHRSIRDYIHGRAKDGKDAQRTQDYLETFTSIWDLSDERLRSRKKDIPRLVESTYKKYTKEDKPSSEWQHDPPEEDLVYTKYPNQGGAMELMVNACMKWMRFPNRPLAVIICHGLVSTLGGRVYAIEDDEEYYSGIVLTAQVVARSTMGKSYIRKFIAHAIDTSVTMSVGDEELPIKSSTQFIGSTDATSVLNMNKEILEKSGSILAVLTESGQMQMSKAGDKARVDAYKLELATNSGPGGHVVPHLQNDKISELFSPSYTCIAESNPRSQQRADVNSDINSSGKAGRQSYVVANPIKVLNKNKSNKIDPNCKSRIKLLYNKSQDPSRKDATEPMSMNSWVLVKIKDKENFSTHTEYWMEKENESYNNDLEATFWGRMHEKVPAWAARLAILDDPEMPQIRPTHIKIAEDSLIAEHKSRKLLIGSTSLQQPYPRLVEVITDLFRGEIKKKSLISRTNGTKMAKDGAIEWSLIGNYLKKRDEWLAVSGLPNFDVEIERRLRSSNIHLVSIEECKLRWNKRSKIFQRV